MQIARAFWLIPGYLFLGLGLAGFFIPGLPGTIFLILALSCFKKGSPRMEAWLLSNRWFGPTLRDWDQNKWIPLKIKVIAVSCIVLFTLGSFFSIPNIWMRIFLALLGAYGAWFVISRRTKPALVQDKSGRSKEKALLRP